MADKFNEILKSKDFAGRLLGFIEDFFGGSTQESPAVETIKKSVDQEQRLALFVVLEPQEGEFTTDVHGDTYTEAEIEKACINFSQHCMKANIFHLIETEDAEIVENYTAPSDFELDGKTIKKGTWLQKWYFPETEIGEALWQGVKSGEFNGVSIQCKAGYEEIE